MDMAKREPEEPNGFKAKYDQLNPNIKALLKFLAVAVVLITMGVIYHTKTDQGMESTQRFLEQRRGMSDSEFQQEEPEEQSAKKRAEKNIFLQK